jgi:hypothetical protein
VQELLQPESSEVRRDREAMRSVTAPRSRKPGIQGDLEVHVVERRQSRADHRLADTVAQVRTEQGCHRVLPGSWLLMHPLEEPAEGTREVTQLAG